MMRMEAVKSTGNPTLRTVIVFALSLYLLVVSGSNFYLFWVPSGRFGYVMRRAFMRTLRKTPRDHRRELRRNDVP